VAGWLSRACLRGRCRTSCAPRLSRLRCESRVQFGGVLLRCAQPRRPRPSWAWVAGSASAPSTCSSSSHRRLRVVGLAPSFPSLRCRRRECGAATVAEGRADRVLAPAARADEHALRLRHHHPNRKRVCGRQGSGRRQSWGMSPGGRRGLAGHRGSGARRLR